MGKVIIVPGLGNSGPTHWQTWFQGRLANTRRVWQADWQHPVLPEWAWRVGAEQWGSGFRDIGSAGHINVDSGHGPWLQGLAFFEQLRAAVIAEMP